MNTIIIMLVLSYLLGSIPNGVWIGKLFYHKDVRDFGSGSMGTTNTFRVLGKKAGTAVLILDILKGTLAASLPYLFDVPVNPLLIGLGAIVGHTFPIFAGFKGGKAVATSAGTLLAYNPIFFLIASAIFVLFIYLTSMVSVGSMAGMVLVTLLSLFYHDPVLTAVAFVLTILVFYRHRDNIKRIKNGTENKVPFGLGQKRSSKK